jgi:hypothetical protein
MLSSALPPKIQEAFGINAGGSYIRTIPVPSQIGITAGAASWNDGFPPLNFLPNGAGGINPFGADFNGVLNAISALSVWYSAGAPISYDSTFQTAIGGYPKGAIVQSAATAGLFFQSTTENNATNPDTGGAGWSGFNPTYNSSDFVESVIPSGSAVSLSNVTLKNITSISLPAGDWDVYGYIALTPVTAGLSAIEGGISTTSVTLPVADFLNVQQGTSAIAQQAYAVPTVRLYLSVTTTVYLVTLGAFGAGTCTAYGAIHARRVWHYPT